MKNLNVLCKTANLPETKVKYFGMLTRKWDFFFLKHSLTQATKTKLEIGTFVRFKKKNIHNKRNNRVKRKPKQQENLQPTDRVWDCS